MDIVQKKNPLSEQNFFSLVRPPYFAMCIQQHVFPTDLTRVSLGRISTNYLPVPINLCHCYNMRPVESPHPWNLHLLVDPVPRLVEENPLIGRGKSTSGGGSKARGIGVYRGGWNKLWKTSTNIFTKMLWLISKWKNYGWGRRDLWMEGKEGRQKKERQGIRK